MQAMERDTHYPMYLDTALMDQKSNTQEIQT